MFERTALVAPGLHLVAIENLEALSIEEVMEQFDVTREQITAVLDFVGESLRGEPIPAGARPL